MDECPSSRRMNMKFIPTSSPLAFFIFLTPFALVVLGDSLWDTPKSLTFLFMISSTTAMAAAYHIIKRHFNTTWHPAVTLLEDRLNAALVLKTLPTDETCFSLHIKPGWTRIKSIELFLGPRKNRSYPMAPSDDIKNLLNTTLTQWHWWQRTLYMILLCPRHLGTYIHPPTAHEKLEASAQLALT